MLQLKTDISMVLIVITQASNLDTPCRSALYSKSTKIRPFIAPAAKRTDMRSPKKVNKNALIW
jgi:hypothetical protein